MKLINSRIEKEIRDNLKNYSTLITENKKILIFLNEQVKEISSVYALNHTIEQGEDIYTLLVNGEIVIDFEISRVNHSIYDVSIKTVSDYSKEIKQKLPKLKLMIALELSKKTNNS